MPKLARARKVQLVHYDGANWSAYDMSVTREGTGRAAGREVALDACVKVSPDLYVLAAGPVEMAQEADFHRSRRRLALASLFSPSGDLVEMVRWIGWGALVVGMFWSVNTVSGLQSSTAHDLAAIKAQVSSVQSTLSKPIQIEVPAGTQVTRP